MKTLIAEVVSIGDEMTSGARLDTNAQWLSQRLGELGIEVQFHSTVGDSLENNIELFRIAAQRADVVVATGGLGPTRDDLTREALAGVTGQSLELDPESLTHIEQIFSRRNREMPERNRVQAMFPAASKPIFNPQGTAPGIEMSVSLGRDCRIFALPGVPAEMKRMFGDSVTPSLVQWMGGGEMHIEHRVLKFFGTGESDMERRLGDMISRDHQPRVGITVSQATISLRITATDSTQQGCLDQISQTRAEIMDRVGDLHFGDGERYEQYHAIDEQLLNRKQSLLVVELGFAAPLGDWFASLGETASYVGGLSFATQQQLNQLLDANSLEQSARTLQDKFQADWILVADGYPDLSKKGDHGLPDATFQVWVTGPDGEDHQITETLGGHPAILQQRIGKRAMQFFRSVCFDHADS